MAEHANTEGEQVVFILLGVENFEQMQGVIDAIEGAGGHVVHSYPLDVVVASVSLESLPGLRQTPGIVSIDTSALSDERMQRMTADQRYAAEQWNARVMAEGHDLIARNISWDAPGFVPPDPPQHVREMLERREEELRTGAESDEGEKGP